MHYHHVARVTRLQQTTDEFLTEYKKKKHILRKMRITIDKQKAKNMEGTQALVWNVNPSSCSLFSSSEYTKPVDLKHSETCACEICDRRREECISMQESILMDVGQGPNSQEANEHLQHLLHLRFEKHTLELQTKTEAVFKF